MVTHNGEDRSGQMAGMAARYAERGWSVVPVPTGKKAPGRDGWQTERWTPERIIEDWPDDHGIGALLGEPSGNLTDLDLDCEEARKLAGRFFSPTLTSSRPGARDAHWWYYAQGRPTGQHSLEDLGREKVLELRGGAGHQTLIPPSSHPSGERWRWGEGVLEAATVPAESLLEGYRQLGTAVIVARTLPQTGRHRFGMALAGFLLGRLDEERAHKVMRAAWDAAGYRGGPTGRPARESAKDLRNIVADTAEKIESGDEYAGGGVLEDLAPGLPKKLSKLWGWSRAQHDTRERGLTSHKGPSGRGKAPSERPEIVVAGRDTLEVIEGSVSAMEKANEPPRLFVRSGLLARVARDEEGVAHIRQVSVDGIRERMASSARYVNRNRKGEPSPTVPPKHVAQLIHASGEWPWLPPLAGLSGVPVLRPDGTVHDAPGYDAGSRIFYDVGPTGELPPRVPDQPSRSDVARAHKHVEKLFQDFPFASETDQANAWGMLLTPVARPWIAGPVPLALIDKPKMGSGASLLAAAVATIATGHAPFLGAPTSEEEWAKVITSALVAGQSVLIFDNIAERIDSAALSRALTSPTWAERLLGTNTVVHIPQRATWIATGNNIAVGGDMPRRCYRIRLDPKVAKPWQRSGFTIPDLVGWASDNRGELVRALLTLCVGWHRAGRPLTSEADDRPRVGGFEGWDRTVSGILAHAGVDGFLGNLDDFYEAADEDAAEWAAFLAAWHDAVGAHPITLHDLVSRFGTIDGREVRAALPGDLAETFEHNERGFTRRLGRALARRNGARYGDEGYFAEEAGEHNRAKKWRVSKDSGTG
jgi:hypothetical protein